MQRVDTEPLQAHQVAGDPTLPTLRRDAHRSSNLGPEEPPAAHRNQPRPSIPNEPSGPHQRPPSPRQAGPNRSLAPRRIYAAIVLLCIAVPLVGLLRPLVRCTVLVAAMSTHTPRLPVRAYLHFFGDRVIVSDVTYPTPQLRTIAARVYTPAISDPPVIVLVHGLQSEGSGNLLLNYWAKRMAECGFAVVLPNVESERRLLMAYQGVEDIGWSAQWAAEHFHRKVTVVGVSFAGGLALAAAEHPEWSRSMAMVLSISGYSSVLRLSEYYLHDRVVGPTGLPYTGPPPQNGPFLIANQYLEALVPPQDLAPVREAMQITFRAQRTTPAGQQALARLTPRQAQELAEITTGTSPRLKAILQRQVQQDEQRCESISPAAQERQLQHLGCPIYLLHGRNDRVIPQGEAQWTRTARQYGKEVHLTVTSGMTHALIDRDSRRLARLHVGLFILRALLRADGAPALPQPAQDERSSPTAF